MIRDQCRFDELTEKLAAAERTSHQMQEDLKENNAVLLTQKAEIINLEAKAKNEKTKADLEVSELKKTMAALQMKVKMVGTITYIGYFFFLWYHILW